MSNQEVKYMGKPIGDYKYARTEFVEVEGIKYAYRSIGKSRGLPIVCLQHFTGTLDNWDPILNSLAKEREVVTIDNRGVGNSGGETPENVRDMSENAIKIITALGIDKCYLQGYSLGGFLAQTIPYKRACLVQKLILVGTAPQGAKALYKFPELVARAFSLEATETFLYIFAANSTISRAKLKAALGRLFDRNQDRDKPSTMATVQAQIKALTRWGTDPETIDLTAIKQPVLIIQGSNHEMMDSLSSLQLHRQISHSILTYYPDSAHGSLFQYPELFVQHVNSFLNVFD